MASLQPPTPNELFKLFKDYHEHLLIICEANGQTALQKENVNTAYYQAAGGAITNPEFRTVLQSAATKSHLIQKGHELSQSLAERLHSAIKRNGELLTDHISDEQLLNPENNNDPVLGPQRATKIVLTHFTLLARRCGVLNKIFADRIGKFTSNFQSAFALLKKNEAALPATQKSAEEAKSDIKKGETSAQATGWTLWPFASSSAPASAAAPKAEPKPETFDDFLTANKPAKFDLELNPLPFYEIFKQIPPNVLEAFKRLDINTESFDQRVVQPVEQCSSASSAPPPAASAASVTSGQPAAAVSSAAPKALPKAASPAAVVPISGGDPLTLAGRSSTQRRPYANVAGTNGVPVALKNRTGQE